MKYICFYDDGDIVSHQIEEFNNDEDAINYFSKFVFYEGDGTIKDPLEYVEDMKFNGCDCYVVKMKDCININKYIKQIEQKHITTWEKHNKQKKEKQEKELYKKLKEKYGN